MRKEDQCSSTKLPIPTIPKRQMWEQTGLPTKSSRTQKSKPTKTSPTPQIRTTPSPTTVPLHSSTSNMSQIRTTPSPTTVPLHSSTSNMSQIRTTPLPYHSTTAFLHKPHVTDQDHPLPHHSSTTFLPNHTSPEYPANVQRKTFDAGRAEQASNSRTWWETAKVRPYVGSPIPLVSVINSSTHSAPPPFCLATVYSLFCLATVYS